MASRTRDRREANSSGAKSCFDTGIPHEVAKSRLSQAAARGAGHGGRKIIRNSLPGDLADRSYGDLRPGLADRAALAALRSKRTAASASLSPEPGCTSELVTS